MKAQPHQAANLLLIRHAETDLRGTFCGHSDPPLNPAGRDQATQLARDLSSEPIHTLVTSDLRRATETAAPLALAQGLAPISTSALREVHFGDWEGLSWKQIEQRDNVHAQRWLDAFPTLPAPGGEPFADFRLRVLSQLQLILHAAQQGPVAVVTHAGVLRVMLEELTGDAPAETWGATRPYASVLRLNLAPSHTNDTPHSPR